MTSATGPFDAQHAAMEAAMQGDIDAHANAAVPQGDLQSSGVRPPMQAPPLQAMMQTMMEQFMQQFMQSMMQGMQQTATGAAQAGQAAPAAFSPQGAGWQHDPTMANVLLDAKAFSRVKKFTDMREEWTEWRAQV